MAEEVSADTMALSHFVDDGQRHLTNLRGVFDEVQRRRTTVISALGEGSPSANTDVSFIELLNETIINNSYVEVVRDALEDFVASGPLAFDQTATINKALSDAGLTLDGTDLSAEQDALIAEGLTGQSAELERLQERIAQAAARGDFALVGQLQAEVDQIVLSGLDIETRSSVIIGRHFEEIFDTDRVEGNLQSRFANLDEDEVRARLEATGLRGQALEFAMDEIVAAASFYSLDSNAGALRTLDDANDGNADGDQILQATDAWLVTAARTADTTSLSGSTIRQESIAGWAAASGLDMDGLENAYYGRSRIGALNDDERDFLVLSYVAGTTDRALTESNGTDMHSNEWLRELFLLSQSELPTELEATLTEAMTAQAVSVEMHRGDDEQGGAVAAALSTSVIVLLGDSGSADLIDGMEPVTAGLFASALNLDQAPDDLMPGSLDYRTGLADGVLRALVERSNGGAMSESGAGFTFMLLSTAPLSAYFDGSERSAFSGSLAEATAIAAFPADAAAQEYHSERLADIFGVPEAMRLLAANGDEIDPGTRIQLVETTVYGRAEATDRYGPAHHWTAEYWTAEDYRSDIEGISLDVMVDVARRIHLDLHGTYPPARFESDLRAIGQTEEGQDLFGLNNDTNFGLRSQLIALTLENDWAVEDFGDGDGWANPVANGDYLVLMAQLTDPGRSFTVAELERLRSIGASGDAQQYLGLETGITDNDRRAYVDLILSNGWTAETFAGDPIENDTVNNALANAHFGTYGPDGPLGAELAELSATGDTEGYVRAALGLGSNGGDAIVGQIVQEIRENSAGGSINLIPVHLNTGNQSVTLMLFEVHGDEGTRYVDLNGKSYSSVGDWREHNELPPGRLSFAGISEGTFGSSEFVAPGSGDDYQIVSGKTKEYPDTFWENYGGPIVTGVVIIGGIAVVIGTLGAATPLVSAGAAATIGTAGAYTLGGVAAYELVTGGDKLYDHVAHGGSWSDPVAVDAYLTLGDGALGLVSLGSYHVATRAGRLAPRLASSLTYANRGAEFLETGLNGYAALQVLNSDLSPEEKRKQLIMLGVFTAVEFGVPMATNRAIGGNQDLPDGVSWTQAQHAIALGAESPDQIRMISDAQWIRPALTGADIDAARTGGATTTDELLLVIDARAAGVKLDPATIVAAARAQVTTAQIVALDAGLTPEGRAAFAELSASPQVIGMDQWFPHPAGMATGSNPTESANQIRRAEYEILTVQQALSDPYYAGYTFDLGADANAPRLPNGGKLASADITVTDSDGNVVGYIEVGSQERPISGATGINSGIAHARLKAEERSDADQPLEATLEARIIAPISSKLDDSSVPGGNRIDNFVAGSLNNPKKAPLYDGVERIVIIDAASNDVVVIVEKRSDGEWIRIHD